MKVFKQLILGVALTATSASSFATVFYSKTEAMELAFGTGATIESLSLFPDDTQTAKIQQIAKVNLESGLFLSLIHI